MNSINLDKYFFLIHCFNYFHLKKKINDVTADMVADSLIIDIFANMTANSSFTLTFITV